MKQLLKFQLSRIATLFALATSINSGLAQISIAGKDAKPVKLVSEITRPPDGLEEFVQKTSKGAVNWSQQYIEAEGVSILDNARFTNPVQAQEMARRGAIADAQRNLLEIVGGVFVEGQTTVKDLITQSDDVKTRVSGTLKGAIPVGDPVYTNGKAIVKLRVSLYQNGLADAVDTNSKKEPVTIDPKNVVSDSVPSNLIMAVKGQYNPRIFPTLTDGQNQVLMNFAKSYDPTNGKAPAIFKDVQGGLKKLNSGNKDAIVEVLQDATGRLVLNGSSAERIEKWKKFGLNVWRIVRTLIFV